MLTVTSEIRYHYDHYFADEEQRHREVEQVLPKVRQQERGKPGFRPR